jgi:hypothetical protein
VGRGSKPKTGLCGFAVSDLNIPGFKQPWELDVGRPGHIASALDIMVRRHTIVLYNSSRYFASYRYIVQLLMFYSWRRLWAVLVSTTNLEDHVLLGFSEHLQLGSLLEVKHTKSEDIINLL